MVTTILALILIEGLLSFDNALVLAVLVKNLKPIEQTKALTYGIFGAYFFRILFVSTLIELLKSDFFKSLGGSYLLFLAVKHFFFDEKEGDNRTPFVLPFWRVIVAIELTDLMFSVDSIVTSVGLSQNVWVVVTGAIIGITMMRFASLLFIKLIEKFPGFERTGFLLVALVGFKLTGSIWFNFESGPFYLVFWVLFWMAVVSGVFTLRKEEHHAT